MVDDQETPVDRLVLGVAGPRHRDRQLTVASGQICADKGVESSPIGSRERHVRGGARNGKDRDAGFERHRKALGRDLGVNRQPLDADTLEPFYAKPV